MKLISQEELMELLKGTRPDIFYVPEGRLLSPAAKDYLNANCIRFDNESRRARNEQREQSTKYLSQNYVSRGGRTTGSKLKFYSGTGGKPAGGNLAGGKPEPMTHVHGNQLVMKDDPVIQYRGKLDSAQAQVVFVQSLIAADQGCPHLLADLEDVLSTMRELMRAEVTGTPVQKDTILGLTYPELRAQSHDPETYFHIPAMQLPSYQFGSAFAGLNLLRTTVREAEVLAVKAFKQGNTTSRPDLIETLNRLSSALHVLMCRYQAGYYTKS